MGYFQAFDYRMLWYRRDEVFFMAKEELFIERRPQGDYAVRRGGAERASAVEPTQAEAIERAKEINNGGPVLVERVRNTDVGHRDTWRKP